MTETTGWMPFDVHDTGNRTPRASLQINTGGNSSSCLMEPIRLDIEPGGPWIATYEDEHLSMTFRGSGQTANGAILALLAHRLDIRAEDVTFNPESAYGPR